MTKVNVCDTLSEHRMIVKKQHLKFDLDRFIMGDSFFGGAVTLITPSQFVMTDCFVKRYSYYDDSINAIHGCSLKTIYSVIYDMSKKIDGYSVNVWRKNILDDGNIFMQLCSGQYFICFIGVPEKISRDQYLALEVFDDRIKEIYDSDKEYFDNEPMIFVLYGDDFSSINDIREENGLDKILDTVKDRIVDVERKNEFIIGDSLDNLRNNKLLIKRR